MKVRLELHLEAVREVDAAVDWYEEQRASLPSGRARDLEVRRFFMVRFPFALPYLTQTEEVMRKPRRDVELDDIISSQIIGEAPDLIALAMKIHLALEALLIEMLRTIDQSDAIYRLSFPAKTERLVAEGLLDLDEQRAFGLLNNFRNDFAHIFGHRITLADTLALAREIESAGIDFSDSAGHYSEAEAIEYYGGTLGILAEIGWCVLFHAASRLTDAGGRNIF